MSLKNKIRIMFYSILLVIILAATVPRNLVDEELKPYDASFKQLANQLCGSNYIKDPRSKVIRFQKLVSPVVGICIPVFNGFKIYIDPKFFSHCTDLEKNLLLYHEFTHCYLGQDHKDTEKFPNHYMNPEMPDYITEKMFNKQVEEEINSVCH